MDFGRPTIEDPSTEDIFHVGTLGTVLQLLKLPDGTVKALIEGLERVSLEKINLQEDMIEAEIKVLPDAEEENPELEGIIRAVLSQFEDYVKLSKKTPPEVLVSVNQI